MFKKTYHILFTHYNSTGQQTGTSWRVYEENIWVSAIDVLRKALQDVESLCPTGCIEVTSFNRV